MKRNALAAAIFVAIATLGLSASARAAGGVIEINQAVVNAAGPFPYMITAPGSYRLSGNLGVSTAGADAIDVSTNNVTIDLNGFTIIQTVSGGTGISAGSVTQVKVVNGTVTGFSTGVAVGANSIVRDVRANDNSSIGINAGASSVVEGCTANSNGITGIVCIGSNCAISGNTANSNSISHGIFCNGNACAISGNTANSNAIYGIGCEGNGCAISGNTLTGNGGGVNITGSAGLILHNALYGNTSFGINSNDSTTAYGENVLDNTSNASLSTSMKNNVCTVSGVSSVC